LYISDQAANTPHAHTNVCTFRDAAALSFHY
jgi:hypothetical protein